MKRLGVVLALLVLFATFSVANVSALENYSSVESGITGANNLMLMPYVVYLDDGTHTAGYYIIYAANDPITTDVEFLLEDGSHVTVSTSNFTRQIFYDSGVDGIEIRADVLPETCFNGKKAIQARFVSYQDSLKPIKQASKIFLGRDGLEINFDSANTAYTLFIHISSGALSYENSYFDGIQLSDGSVYAMTDSDGSISNNDPAASSILIFGFAEKPPKTVTISVSDALTGESIAGVTVKEGDIMLGTLNGTGTIKLSEGPHLLIFEKDGYHSETLMIDVQGDMTVSVEMYPSSAAFKLEKFPSDITIPENTIYTLTFTLSPIDTSATYNTYLAISGLSDVLEVKKDGSAISPESGKYYLGDISGPTQVSIKFKAGAVGTHGFTLTLTSNDAIMSQTYTTTKTITYTVEPLPFSVQMPSEWQVGENSLRISESSGQSYLITAVLKDSQGNEVWSDSYAFSPYEAHTFSINVPSEGSYTLELTWNGQTAVYDITVNPAITLKTKTLTVQEGGEGTIVLHFKNPSSSVQYYTIKVSGGFLPAEINQSISVAPLSEKDVSIAFAVPEDLTYDAYELNVQVLQGDSVVFSDKVAVTIDSGGFTLFGGGSNTPTWAYALLGLLVLGGLVWALRRR